MSETLGDANGVLWRIGWNPLVVIGFGSVLGFVVGLGSETPVAGVLVLGLGVACWIAGVSEINDKYPKIMEKYGEYTEMAARNRAPVGASSTYTLTYSSGSAPLVDPAKRYHSILLVVGDSAVSIHDGVGVNVVERTPYLNDNSKEIYYDQIASVSYDRPLLEITTSNGNTLGYRSNGEPDGALNELQDRLRTYKTVA